MCSSLLVHVDSAKDRNRRAILRKITTFFSISVPPLLPNDTAKRSREHFQSNHDVCLMPTLERNAPWSRRKVSFHSRRQHERPKSTGDSEKVHHYTWHLGPSCVAKRSREHFTSNQGVHLTPTLERNAPWSRRTVSFCSRRQRERPKLTGYSEEKCVATTNHWTC